MTSLKTKLAELRALREKATQGEWQDWVKRNPKVLLTGEKQEK
jgi:hypothetical protein